MKAIVYSSLLIAASAFAHDGHGLPGAHWHASDAWGFVAGVAAAAIGWFLASRK
jgi:hypothetical protein